MMPKGMNRQHRKRGVYLLRFGILVSLVLGLVASTAASPVHAEEEVSRAGTPINVGKMVTPARDYLSSSSALALERVEAMYTGQPDPYFSAAGGANSSSAASAQQVPFRNPAPAFSRNILITRNLGYAPYQTEPTLAVDPFDPEHLIMGTIDYNMGSTMSTYTTFDGGETWQGPIQVPRFRNDIVGAGDPVVTFDSDGSAYITMISIGVREFQIGSISSETTVLNMAVSKSTDGGLTWSDPAMAAEGSVSTVSNIDDGGKERGVVTFVDLDKPWITTGPNPNDPDSDIIYMSYTEFESSFTIMYADEIAFFSQPILATTIKVVASENGGDTWSEPVDVSPKVLFGFGAATPLEIAGSQGTKQAGGGGLSTRVVQGSQIDVLPDGTVVAAYYDSTEDGSDEGLAAVMVAMSSDAAATFTDPVQAGVYREVPFRLRTAEFRYGALPSMITGPNGEIYIAQSGRSIERPNDDSDVYFFRSFDGGTTWDSSLLLDESSSSGNQFFPVVATSPDGTVHMMWGDQRDDPVGLRYHIYYTQSTDQGETWGFTLPDQDFTAPDTRVTDFPSNPMKGFPSGRFIGDYMSMVATEDDVYLVWPDTRLGEFGGFSQQIGFARQTAIEAPTLFLSPPQGSAGRIVDIQGFGFQPDSQIQLYVSGVITSTLLTDNEGLFQTSIYMPLTGEGPTQISAFDETGNVATASFFTEFGFDTLQRSLDEIDTELAGLQTEVDPESAEQSNGDADEEAVVGTPEAN